MNMYIRPYQSTDEPAIEAITFLNRNGFTGDKTDQFEDMRLFYLMFIAYYTRWLPEHAFVAVEGDGSAVIGYILGCPDTTAQEAHWGEVMPSEIAAHIELVTQVRYPRALQVYQDMAAMSAEAAAHPLDGGFLERYPAHLHINLHPDHHSQGIGTRLFTQFEMHLRGLGVPGLHLQTSNYNVKAIPFYRKMGFTLHSDEAVASHPLVSDYRVLTFAKTL
jgi:GNAT superfamily N-acetyltransferase